MSDDSATPQVAQRTSLLRKIDEICDRFEAAWKAGRPPLIDHCLHDSLPDADPDVRRQLLVELVMIDLEYRWRRAAQTSGDLSEPARWAEDALGRPGESPLPLRPRLDDYLARYPELAPSRRLPDDLMALERHVRNRWGRRWRRRAQGGACIDEFKSSDRFARVRKIGAGGMGVVYQAYDRKLDQVVAIKTIRNVEAAAIYRLKREFRSLVDLRHPNLVALYELFSLKAQWFFTMELVDGVDFLSYVRFGNETNGAELKTAQEGEDASARRPAASGEPAGEEGVDLRAETEKVFVRPWEETVGGQTAEAPLRPSQLIRLRKALKQVAEGVLALHQAQKLHRDVKPSNVLVTPSGRVVLLDFGLTTELDPSGQNGTTGVNVVGTVPYMSPEQAAREKLSPASDWYSVGVMLYEALAGRQPFSGNVLDVLMEKQQTDPPPPSELIAGIPEDLNRLCVWLIRRSPHARPAGPEVLRLLDAAEREPPALSTGQVESAFPPPPAEHQEHLEALHDAFRTMQRGRSVAAFVCGKSGVGKTALVERFLDEIRRGHQTVILSGRCNQCESVPYKALDGLVDVLSHYLMGLPRLEADALMPRDALELSELFPVLPRVEAVAQCRRRDFTTPDREELRNRAFHGLRELLARLGDRKALVLFVDDLQWSDLESLAQLQNLVRSPDPPVLLLVLCYRTEFETPGPIARGIAELQRVTSRHIDICEIEVGPVGG